MVQLVPSQCSIRLPILSGEKLRVNPTAQASVAEVAAADTRMLFGSEVLGLDTTVHEVPSQCWISVMSCPFGFMRSPTAQALVEEVAAIPRDTAF
jgi:hypothetical protein